MYGDTLLTVAVGIVVVIVGSVVVIVVVGMSCCDRVVFFGACVVFNLAPACSRVVVCSRCVVVNCSRGELFLCCLLCLLVVLFCVAFVWHSLLSSIDIPRLYAVPPAASSRARVATLYETK